MGFTCVLLNWLIFHNDFTTYTSEDANKKDEITHKKRKSEHFLQGDIYLVNGTEAVSA